MGGRVVFFFFFCYWCRCFWCCCRYRCCCCCGCCSVLFRMWHFHIQFTHTRAAIHQKQFIYNIHINDFAQCLFIYRRLHTILLLCMWICVHVHVSAITYYTYHSITTHIRKPIQHTRTHYDARRSVHFIWMGWRGERQVLPPTIPFTSNLNLIFRLILSVCMYLVLFSPWCMRTFAGCTVYRYRYGLA